VPLVERMPVHQEPVVPLNDRGEDADGHEAMPTPGSGGRLADPGFGKREARAARGQDPKYALGRGV
jgi:hypothetical protein